MRALRVLTNAVVGAVVAGVILGVLSRVLMRLLTITAGGEPRFSWSGTFFIVLLYVAAVVPAALVAAITAVRWLRWLAGAAGAAFLTVPALGVSSEELGALPDVSAMTQAGLIVASVAVFATVFAAPVAAIRLVDRLKGRAPVAGAARPVPELEPAG